MLFLNSKLKSKDWRTREKAIACVQDEKLLMAMILSDPHPCVVSAGIKAIPSEDTLLMLAKQDGVKGDIRREAFSVWVERKKAALEKAGKGSDEAAKIRKELHDTCFRVALTTDYRSEFISAMHGLTTQEELLELLAAMGRRYESRTGYRLAEQQKCIVMSSYDTVCKDVYEELTDVNLFALALCHPDVHYYPRDRIYKIEDYKVLQKIADEATSEYARKEARSALEHFAGSVELKALKAELAKETSVDALLERITEAKPEHLNAYADRLAQVGSFADNSKLENLIYKVNANRSGYQPGLRITLTNVYGKWNQLDWKEAKLRFADQQDLDRMKKDLDNPENIMNRIFALNDLQQLYKMGRFTAEIAGMTYRGQPVPTYKDPNADSIIV